MPFATSGTVVTPRFTTVPEIDPPTGNAPPETGRWPVAVAGALILASSYLVFFNLDQTHFWDDEAQVGMMATNLLETGRITGWDGRNLFAYRNGRSLDGSLRPRTPPLDYVIAAGSFRVFGRSTWAGRFPFAVLGILTLVVLFVFVRRASPETPWLGCWLVGILGLSPLFVLNARAGRYNAPCMLFAITAFLAFEGLLSGRGRKPLWTGLLCVSSGLLFYAHFLMAAGFLVALAVVFVVFEASRAKVVDWGLLVLAGLGFLAATIPYAVRYAIWERPDMEVAEPWLLRHAKLVAWNLRELNTIGMLPWAVCVLAIFAIRRSSPSAHARFAAKALALGLVYTVTIALLSPQPTFEPNKADVRYLVAAIPILAIPVGYAAWWLGARFSLAGLALAGTLVACNSLSVPNVHRWMLPGYLAEIHQPYPTNYGAVTRFLAEHADDEDVVYAYPEHKNYPLVFYLGDRLRFGCLIDETSPIREQVDELDAPLRLEDHFPRWFIAFGNTLDAKDRFEYFSRVHEVEGRPRRFEYVPRATIPLHARDTHRPELFLHSFGPFEPRPREMVYVFERVERPVDPEGDRPDEGGTEPAFNPAESP